MLLNVARMESVCSLKKYIVQAIFNFFQQSDNLRFTYYDQNLIVHPLVAPKLNIKLEFSEILFF